MNILIKIEKKTIIKYNTLVYIRHIITKNYEKWNDNTF